LFSGLKRLLLGERLSVKAAKCERLTNSQGLAIFGADSLSSTAYATEEILLVLAAAGAGTFFVSIPTALAIAALILLVVISYQQVIYAYPQGGGVYNVAKENLGEFPALLGGASLLIDYVLTVAVSVAAGVAAITSAVPALLPWRVWVGSVIIGILTLANLRGVRESGKIFSLPTFGFIVAILGMTAYGVWRYAAGTFPVTNAITADPASDITGALGVFLILRAFASGCTAMTGIEATSNGVPMFQPPESQNAAHTMMRMGLLLGVIFVGVTFLAYWGGIGPREHETVISQVARMLVGSGPLYYLIQGATMLVLLLAANTPFAGFPMIASQLARDGYFPRQFQNIGYKLVFANGIIVLGVLAVVLLYLFNGNVHALIPLYAVGVFLGFSISQFGMVMRWRRLGGRVWLKIAINSIGFLVTSAVFAVVLMTKFLHGAWLLIPAVILLMVLMKNIKRHYIDVEARLSLDGGPVPKIPAERTMVVLVSSVSRATVYAAQFAKSFNPVHLRAVHVATSVEEGEAVRKKWEQHMPDVPIDILVSEYRDLFTPVLGYLKDIQKKWSDDTVIVVLPEFIPNKIFHHFLHNQTALRLRLAIEQDPDVDADILDVPVKVRTHIR